MILTAYQLPLNLKYPTNQRFESFHPGENLVQLQTLKQCINEPQAPWVFLSGPHGSGKTHLLMASCQESPTRRAQYLPLSLLKENAEAALMALTQFDLLCIDDVQFIGGNRGAEIALFDVFNRGKAEGATMIFAARFSPNQLPLVLPDLASRLASCVQCTINPLSEVERREVLKQRAHARGFELDENMLEFLFRRNARDLGALLQLLDRVDQESLSSQRKITIPFLKRLIGLPSEKKPRTK